MKGVYIFLADGFEVSEALTTVNMLRRGGVNVKTVSIYDVMIFPGGMPGSSNLAAFGKLMDIMQQHYTEGGTLAAICAAPSVVLGLLPNLEGKKMTCYDGFEDTLTEKGAEYVKEGVVIDGQLITGRGPGWAVEFGLAILAKLKGQEVADKVKAGLML